MSSCNLVTHFVHSLILRFKASQYIVNQMFGFVIWIVEKSRHDDRCKWKLFEYLWETCTDCLSKDLSYCFSASYFWFASILIAAMCYLEFAIGNPPISEIALITCSWRIFWTISFFMTRPKEKRDTVITVLFTLFLINL